MCGERHDVTSNGDIPSCRCTHLRPQSWPPMDVLRTRLVCRYTIIRVGGIGGGPIELEHHTATAMSNDQRVRCIDSGKRMYPSLMLNQDCRSDGKHAVPRTLDFVFQSLK